MRYLLIFLLAFSLSSCTDDGFEREYYESISGLATPLPYRVEETVDNKQFVTVTSLSVDSASLRVFLAINDFSRLRSTPGSIMLGENLLTKSKPDESNTDRLYYNTGMKNSHIWVYIADLDRNILWMEIQYPGK